MEDTIFEMELPVDKNSREFDLELLNSIIGKTFKTKKFETEMRKIFRKKSSCKLWWDNKPVDLWDGKEYHYVNYRCCPPSHKARHIFGLVLDRNEDIIVVKDGFLEAV